MNARILFFVLSFINSLLLSSQESYFLKDTTVVIGVSIPNRGRVENTKECVVEFENKRIEYFSPNSVSEYKNNDGKLYVAKKVFENDSFQRVFVEKLVSGNKSLYVYRKPFLRKQYFYSINDSLLHDISRRNSDGLSYKKQLNNIFSDCNDICGMYRVIQYCDYSFSEIFKSYNNCESKFIQYYKYGIFAGISSLKPVLHNNVSPSVLNNIKFDRSNNLYLGVWTAFPLFYSNIAFFASFGISNSYFDYSYSSVSEDLDAYVSSNYLKVPVKVNWFFYQSKVGPFLSLGFSYLNNFKRDEMMMYGTKKQNSVFVSFNKNVEFLSHQYIGLIYGLGIEYEISIHRSIYFELNGNYYLPKENDFIVSSFDVTLGINIF